MFFGTSAFAVPSLRALASHADVELVVTQPDRPSGRGRRVQPTPVKAAAREIGIPTIEPQRFGDALPALEEQHADAFAVVSYGRIIPQRALDLPKLPALNVHPSLLPLYRGATPLQSAIRDGRSESGVTVIAMDAGMDTGDIVAQQRTAIGPRETYGELHDRYALLGAELLFRALEAAVKGTLVRIPQADLGFSAEEIAATVTRPLTKGDLFLDWAWPAGRIVDHVRSLSPVPLARGMLRGVMVKVVAAHVLGENEAEGMATIGAGDGRSVVLEEVVPPNRAPMSGAAFFRSVAPA